ASQPTSAYRSRHRRRTTRRRHRKHSIRPRRARHTLPLRSLVLFACPRPYTTRRRSLLVERGVETIEELGKCGHVLRLPVLEHRRKRLVAPLADVFDPPGGVRGEAYAACPAVRRVGKPLPQAQLLESGEPATHR